MDQGGPVAWIVTPSASGREGGGPPCGGRTIQRGTNELLVQQDSVPDGEITSPIQEGTKHTHPLSNFPLDLIDVRRPGELCIWGHSQITNRCPEPTNQPTNQRVNWEAETCAKAQVDVPRSV